MSLRLEVTQLCIDIIFIIRSIVTNTANANYLFQCCPANWHLHFTKHFSKGVEVLCPLICNPNLIRMSVNKCILKRISPTKYVLCYQMWASSLCYKHDLLGTTGLLHLWARCFVSRASYSWVLSVPISFGQVPRLNLSPETWVFCQFCVVFSRHLQASIQMVPQNMKRTLTSTAVSRSFSCSTLHKLLTEQRR